MEKVIFMRDHKHVIRDLNAVYMKVLGRPVDESGLASYSHMLPEQKDSLINILKSSAEYYNLQKQKESKDFNSMAGDRKTYISSKDTTLLDKSVFSTQIKTLIELLRETTNSKIDTKNIKLSLINTIQNNLRITIFPHFEYLFNTNRFIRSLKEYKNFKYYFIYICIIALLKMTFDKIVGTCGTREMAAAIRQKPFSNFAELFDNIKFNALNYLSVDITGNTLEESEVLELSEKIMKDQNSKYVIEYLESKNPDKEETATITKNINALAKKLGRKPKVLVHVAYLENQESYLLFKMLDHAYNLQEANPLLDIDLYFENDRVSKESDDYTPWSRVKRIRNIMLSRTDIDAYDYIYVIDSDIVNYPEFFPSRAVGLNTNGITAPIMLIENTTRFYDWCGYQIKGRTSINSEFADYIMMRGCSKRNFLLEPPYIPNNSSRLAEIDCVGCTYVVPTSTFKNGYGDLKEELLEVFNLANVKNHKINEDIVQYEDHPSFTDHYTVCAALRSQGGKVLLDRGSVGYHADLPIYGENWH